MQMGQLSVPLYKISKNRRINYAVALITWRISARWGGLKYCCDYMTNFNPGLNVRLDAKYEIALVESPKNQNGKDKNCENGHGTSQAI